MLRAHSSGGGKVRRSGRGAGNGNGSGGGSDPTTDPYFANVLTLLHLDSMDGSRHTPDSGPLSAFNVYNVEASPTIDGTKPEYGAGSLFANNLTSISTGIRWNHNNAWNMAADDFTIEASIWWNTVNNTNFDPVIYSKRAAANQATQEIAYFNGTLMMLYTTDGNPANWIGPTVAWTPSTGRWYKLAFVRSGNNGLIFVDGTQVGTTQSHAGTMFAGTAEQYIGMDGSNSVKFDGYIDEVRITKGVARYTSNYTPRTTAFPNS